MYKLRTCSVVIVFFLDYYKRMNKTALIHVEDTENLVELAEYLTSTNWTLLSANETEEFLKKQKFPIVHEESLSFLEQNQINADFSLIEKILNARIPEQDENGTYLNAENKDSIQLVCINVEPKLKNFDDIKGPVGSAKPRDFFISSILRNSYQNYENILILTDPQDYKEAIIQLKTDNILPDFRRYLAAKALNLCSAYDGAISDTLLLNTKLNKNFMNYLMYPFKKETLLKSGSNPQQKSCFYKYPTETGAFSGHSKIQGHELDYNNVTDISYAWEQISILYSNLKTQFSVKSTNSDGYDFTTQFTPLIGTVFTIAVKLKSIIGAAISTSVLDSFKKTYTYDKKNIKEVTFASSAVIDESAAKQIVNCDFVAVVAPGFTPDAKQILSENKKMKLISTAKVSITPFDIELINSGLLVQTRDSKLFKHWYIKTKNRPSQFKTDEMAFGMLLVSSSRSYSAALIKENSIVGISQSTTSTLKAVEDVFFEAKRHALRNNQNSGNAKLADILVCDAAFPFCEIVKDIINNGVSAIIQTGGTETDEEFINYCNEHDVVMVFTGITHISY